MSLGSPLVVSDIPVHREICENSAIYFNPRDVRDIKQKVEFACSLIQASRKDLMAGGLAQAKKFSWKKTAEETLKVYESAQQK
jgi:glycosyltransferase involved in cell wall biosynthesis